MRFFREIYFSLTIILTLAASATFAAPKISCPGVLTKSGFLIPDVRQSRSFLEGQTTPILIAKDKGYISMSPQPFFISDAVRENAIIKRGQRPWNQDEFLIPRQPLIAAAFDPIAIDNSPIPSVADIPIKFPHTDVRLPNELASLKEIIQSTIDYEKAINGDYEDYYAYLYADQRIIFASESHRHPNPHADGIQGREYPVKLPVAHTYLLTTRDTTVFFTNAFDLRGVDVNTANFLPYFERQADYAKIYRPQPGQLAVFDNYTVHASPIVQATGLRTLIRIIFEQKKFDNLGNTHNPHFHYKWNMRPRPIPRDLE